MNELEKLRKQIMKKQDIVILIGIPIILFLIFGCKNLETSDVIWTVILVVLFMFIISKILTYVDISKYNKMYKEQFVLNVLSKHFTDLTLDTSQGIDEEAIDGLQIMKMGNRYYSNDHLTGKYKNIHFEVSDVVINHVTEDSDGGKTTTTYFRGQWFIFDFYKEFHTNVAIVENNFYYKTIPSTMKKIELEDVAFHNMFEVYGEDEHEVFYLLTPKVMENLRKANETITGSMLIGFKDNKLYIGLNDDYDFFEPDIYTEIDNEKETSKIEKDLSVIINFIDILELDNDYFKN